MQRFLFTVLLVGLSAAAVRAEPVPLSAVMAEVRADRWDEARTLARGHGRVMRDIVEWRFLRAGQGQDFGTYVDFLDRNPGWPGLAVIRAQAEGTITGDIDPQTVLDFFDGGAPSTGIGGLRLAQAYAALGRQADAAVQAVLTWHTLPLDAQAQAQILAQFGPVLADHHIARLDAMLWQNEAEAARLMLPLVSEDWAALAEARLALRAMAAGVDARIEAVPEAMQGDPGLAYERFLWRWRKGRREDALAMLEERSTSFAALGEPWRWARIRADLARRLMLLGEVNRAYRLASSHYLSEGATFAELEWLAGYIALRHLDRPETALIHFNSFGHAVRTPISLGRAGYWQGRALEALGQTEEALAAYRRGGAHQTSFYGQLAAERAGMEMDSALIGHEVFPDWQDAGFINSSQLKAALLFAQAGERNLAEWFFTHMAEGADAKGQAQLAGLALSLNEPHIALMVAKEAAGQGNVMPRAYFPLTGLAGGDHPVATELVLAIARRESEFDPGVTSGAGARGLMQLMPGTARDVSRDLELPYSLGGLLTDPDYNATLGAAYLAQLVDSFGPNYVLVAAGYNAGPSRPIRWIEENGDPRAAGVDVVDWIEAVPFDETRNYIMRIMESLAVYRARLSGKTQPLQLSRDLKAG